MSATLEVASLEDAVAQLVSIGYEDPLSIARKVIETRGDEWLAEQMLAYAEDFIADMGRRQLGAVRRKAEVALRPGDHVTSAELKLSKAWVPNVGWKKSADLTVGDLRAQADWYENFATALMSRAVWHRDVALLMEREGVRKLGALKVALPALPDGDLAELCA